MASLGRAAAVGTSSTLLWQGIRVGLLALSFVVLARLLEPADFGLVAMVLAVIGVGELLRDFGLSMAAVQAKTLTQEEKSNLFWVNSALGAALTVVAFAMAAPIAALFDTPALVHITQLLSVTFLLNGLATQFKAQINRDLRFTTLGIVETVPQALGFVSAVAVAMWLSDYRALVAQALVAASSALLLDVLASRWRPGRYHRSVSVRRFLSFGGALAGTQSIAYLSKNIDTVLLGLTTNSAQLGLYNRAYQIVILPLSQITAPTSRVAVPVLARVNDQPDRFLRFVKTGQFASVAISSVFYGSVVGLAEPLVRVMLGTEWVGMTLVLQILAISGIFRVLGQVPYWVYLASGNSAAQFRMYLMYQPMIPISIAAGLAWGPVGVASGACVGYGLFWVAQMTSVRKVPVFRGMAFETAQSGAFLAMTLAVPIALAGQLLSAEVSVDLAAIVLSAMFATCWGALICIAVPTYRKILSGILQSVRGGK